MHLRTRLLKWFILSPLSMLFICAASFAGLGSNDPPITSEPPLDPCNYQSYTCASVWGLGAAPKAWKLECTEPVDKEVRLGDLSISTLKGLDANRCYRVITGDLIFDAAADQDFYAAIYLALPYLEKIVGDLVIVRDQTSMGQGFNQIRLPRLTALDGNVDFDLRPAFEELHLPGLNSLNQLKIRTRTANNNFTGLDSILFIQNFEFNDTSSDAPTTYGLNGLQSVDYLTLKGSTISPSQGRGGTGFLENLVNVNHNVLIDGNMTSLWMLQQLETIGGNLTIKATQLQDLSELSSLNTVGGVVNIATGGNIDTCDINALMVQLGKAGPMIGC